MSFGVGFLATPAGDVVVDWSTVPRPVIVSVGAASEGERTKCMAAGTTKKPLYFFIQFLLIGAHETVTTHSPAYDSYMLALQAFATGSVAAMDAKGGQRAHTPRFGIVTLYDGSAKYECAMPHWCASAKQLSGHIKNSEVAIISKNRSVDCPDVGYFWGEPGAVADVASLGYLARHRIGGSWAHLKNAVLLKVVVFSLVQYESPAC